MSTFGSELILARLHALHPKVIDLSLERIERLLNAHGYHSLGFDSAEAFLEAQGLMPIDCLVLDIRLVSDFHNGRGRRKA